MNPIRLVSPASVFVLSLLGSIAQANAQPAQAEVPTPVAPASPETATAAPATQSPAAPAPQAEASKSEGPKIDVSVPAPGPEVQRQYQMHEGFYLRGNLGIGLLSNRFDDGSLTTKDLSGSGFAFSFDLLAGGSPAPGFTVGGALISSAAFSSSFERDGQKADRDASLGMLGVFVDGFPKATGGFHLGGAFGLAQVKIEKQLGDLGKDTLGGFGGAAWIGQDFWVADEFSMGGLLRFAGALTSASQNSVETSASTFSTSLMFTTLYN